jgi:hypothetical protein
VHPAHVVDDDLETFGELAAVAGIGARFALGVLGDIQRSMAPRWRRRPPTVNFPSAVVKHLQEVLKLLN